MTQGRIGLSADEFARWLDNTKLNDRTAELALGIARKSISKYRKEGAPLVVALACDAITLYADAAEEIIGLVKWHYGDQAGLNNAIDRILYGRGIFGARKGRVLEQIERHNQLAREEVPLMLRRVMSWLSTGTVDDANAEED